MADELNDRKLSDQEVLRSLNYLGHPTTVLQASQGDISQVGQGPAPVPTAPGAGTVGGSGMPGRAGTTGAEGSLLGSLGKLGPKALELINTYMKGDPKTRGDSATLSDQLRSAGMSGVDAGILSGALTGTGEGAQGVNAFMQIPNISPEFMTPDMITNMLKIQQLGLPMSNEILGGLLKPEELSALFSGVEGTTGALGETAGIGVGTTVGEASSGLPGGVGPYAAALSAILGGVMGDSKLPASQQAINAAIDIAASFFGPFGAAAAPLAKTQLGDIYAVAGGTANPLQIAELVAGPAGIPLVMGEALANVFGFDLGGLFNHQGSYVPKRQAAGQEATSSLQGIGASLQNAASAFAQSGNLGDALAGLQTQFGGARNPVKTALVLPPDIAAKVGIAVTGDGNVTQPWGAEGPLSVGWTGMTPDQFGKLLTEFKANPELLGTTLRGSGDVGYLPQEQAEQVAASAKRQGVQYLQFLIDTMPTTTTPEAPKPTAGQIAATGGDPSGAGGLGAQLTKEQMEKLMGQL